MWLITLCIFCCFIVMHVFSERVLVKFFEFKIAVQKRLIFFSVFYTVFYLFTLFYFEYELLEVLYALLVDTSLIYTYFHFFNMSLTARRVNILIDIYNAAMNENRHEREFSYSHKDMIYNRINRLADLGQIQIVNQKLFIKSRFFLNIGIILSLIGRFFIGVNRID